MNCGPGTSEPANTYHISVGVSFVHLTLREFIYLFVYFRYPVANYIDVDKCRGIRLPMSINQSIEICVLFDHSFLGMASSN